MNAIIKNKRFVLLLTAVPVLLLVLFIAMQISPQVNWSGFDFLVGAILLTITALSVEGVLRTAKTTKSRLILLVGVFLVFVLVWAELAVGVFGTPFAGS